MKTTIVTDTGRGNLKAGRKYRVQFFTRAGIGRNRPRTLIAARTLTAKALKVTSSTRAPTCSTSLTSASENKLRVGQRATVKIAQLLFYKDPARSYIASLSQNATFKVRKFSPTGRYAYGFAYGRLNRAGWVKSSGLAPSS